MSVGLQLVEIQFAEAGFAPRWAAMPIRIPTELSEARRSSC
jgi:hypothetical protein